MTISAPQDGQTRLLLSNIVWQNAQTCWSVRTLVSLWSSTVIESTCPHLLVPAILLRAD